MSDHDAYSDTRLSRIGTSPGELSSNGHWIFGSIYAGLAIIGFAFGVWVGAAKPKVVEVVEAKPKEPSEQVPEIKPQPAPPATPKEKEPDPEPKAKDPEPKPKEKDPEPKVKDPEPEPKPKEKEPEPKQPAIKPVAFKDVRPILMNYCGNCHGQVGKPRDGIDLRTVAAIMKGGDGGDIVKPGAPEESRLYLSITEGTMPKDGKPAPSEKELKLLHDWILSGAKE